ncbi:hypothetical protein COEREDRAFT_61166 [Coemansia reversa NRRL 1564]|uniref:Membrane insertase YidC/Oxa/ALB C-terminal domain-containing protein n=1 Tax=Coemansia reversa (strain ATCC 12441 / NRRL 1564) TaxID=763665 RepID=A0A2G5BDV6_COERN|nr:hypothetical protein COEREDRAFT_61166 [Coemansia reversa NRRL 1564]|eukprot:PIA17199.1 hypothetical protein COEREDRAFT_61166 [Coemansia reversa NRRL 1564]
MSQTARFGRTFIAKAMNSPTRIATLQSKTRLSAPSGLRSDNSKMSFRGAAVLRTSRIGWGPVTAIELKTGLGSHRGFHTSPQRSVEQPSVAESTIEAASAVPQTDMSAAAADTGMQIGDLAQHGLDVVFPVRMAEYLLEYVHVMTGLPWWATIGVVLFSARTLLMPVSIWGHRHMLKSMQAQPEITRIQEKIMAARERKDRMAMVNLTQDMTRTRKRLGVSLIKPVLGNAPSIPIVMCTFLALRDMATNPMSHLDTGGILWFVNLARPDVFYILPVLSALGTIGMIEVNNRLMSATETPRGMRIFIRLAAGMGAYFTSGFSAAVLLLWIFNTTFSLCQSMLFHSKFFCRLMNFPEVKKVKIARPSPSMIDMLELEKLVGKTKPKQYVLKRKEYLRKD